MKKEKKIDIARRIARKHNIIEESVIVTISKNLKRKDFDLWLDKLVWRKKKQMKPNTRLYGTKNNWLSPEEVLLKVDISWSTAVNRLKKWERGEISKEEVFLSPQKPFSFKKTNKKEDNVESLLKHIPGQTEFEKLHPEIFEK